MSLHDDVDAAVLALVMTIAGAAAVVGLDGSEAVLSRVVAGGRIAVGDGDPGDPDVTLSPLTYSYDRAIAIEITGTADVVRAILGRLSAAIEANRTLGGLVEFLDAGAPVVSSEAADGAPVIAEASATIVATYSTTHPL